MTTSVYEVRLQQTFELSTKVEAPNERVALEMARMEMRTNGVVVDEAADYVKVKAQPAPDAIDIPCATDSD